MVCITTICQCCFGLTTNFCQIELWKAKKPKSQHSHNKGSKDKVVAKSCPKFWKCSPHGGFTYCKSPSESYKNLNVGKMWEFLPLFVSVNHDMPLTLTRFNMCPFTYEESCLLGIFANRKGCLNTPGNLGSTLTMIMNWRKNELILWKLSSILTNLILNEFA
jgi:hypothetical protein